jgi:hypothetical protein
VAELDKVFAYKKPTPCKGLASANPSRGIRGVCWILRVSHHRLLASPPLPLEVLPPSRKFAIARDRSEHCATFAVVQREQLFNQYPTEKIQPRAREMSQILMLDFTPAGYKVSSH